MRKDEPIIDIAVQNIAHKHGESDLRELVIMLDNEIERLKGQRDALLDTNYQGLVRKFHIAFSRPAPGCYTLLTRAQVELRAKLMYEELMEFMEASRTQVYTDPVGRTKVVALAEINPSYTPPDEVGMIDALVDLLYVTYGTAVEMGVNLDLFFPLVHEANMAKLGPDGKPIVRPDGKVIKPVGWKPPDIKGALDFLKSVAEEIKG